MAVVLPTPGIKHSRHVNRQLGQPPCSFQAWVIERSLTCPSHALCPYKLHNSAARAAHVKFGSPLHGYLRLLGAASQALAVACVLSRKKNNVFTGCSQRGLSSTCHTCCAASLKPHGRPMRPPSRPGYDSDSRLSQVEDDPRYANGAALGKAQKAAMGSVGLHGRNTVSFDPSSTLVRPSMRVLFGPRRERYNKPIRHDDVIIVPDFFCAEDDWDLYYKLIQEMRQLQAEGSKKAEWVPWHEGAHLLTQKPEGSQTYQHVVDKCCSYFSINKRSYGTRFNWYRDGADWKPFHHDSAAFNPQRALRQNCTVGVSFGASRELAFRHAKTEDLIYFPQTNGMMFYFGRDVNIRWQHGINALPLEEQDGRGRISIILWGQVAGAVEEDGSPSMLTDGDRRGHHDMRSRSKAVPCRNFLRGHCSYGERCRFLHDRAPSPDGKRSLEHA